ncbi:hypothetical protein [Pseudoalteromonas luteoviolacea]|uniref:Uncharacterized protein n=1 Tax=Pseudoalteromonas luteoviolacea (strain 2ta16) TaxID=1353533 RepID=V4J864_PSEL2|nr:hypothetical protein [Pseudoalteromonas luteoviolacea]ESP91437.1 hypothetical protein PL2TA16_00236 [Pseudoalteromonas luteoviolacea 2ta16]KZN40086.1 hypothetical protein N483_18025 [Pseudoalteromonas luteoviolacea NCIMB 1944]
MIKSLSLVCAVVSMSAVSNEIVYDADLEAGASTQYTQGPISEVVVQSRRALHISALYTVTTPDAQCTSASVINENTWQPIAELAVQGNTAINGAIPEGYESTPKALKITCHSANQTYTVFHKVPAAPQITWQGDVVASGWTSGDHAWYYKNIDYSSTAFINNNAPDGQCIYSNLVGLTPNVIEEKDGTPFNSAYFSIEGIALAGGGLSYDTMVSEIVCKNAGGTTRALEIWDLGFDHNPAPTREITVYSY